VLVVVKMFPQVHLSKHLNCIRRELFLNSLAKLE